MWGKTEGKLKENKTCSEWEADYEGLVQWKSQGCCDAERERERESSYSIPWWMVQQWATGDWVTGWLVKGWWYSRQAYWDHGFLWGEVTSDVWPAVCQLKVRNRKQQSLLTLCGMSKHISFHTTLYTPEPFAWSCINWDSSCVLFN